MSSPTDAFTDGALSGDAEPPDLVGQVLGAHWQIVRHIGEGSMGHVYEARHLDDGPARAAVKVLHTGLVADADLSFRFRREADILEAIESPHVPRLFDRGRDPRGRPFFVLELLAGVDLGSRIETEGPFPFDMAIDVARQVAQALSAAHRAGVVHRDLKSGNVMIVGGDLQAEGPRSALVVKVLDFSISKVEGLAVTREGVILGTPAYMSPEQALGEPATPLVDVYGVGAVLYDMLTGHPPFDEGAPGKTLAAVLTKEAPRPRSLRADIPETLEAIVLRATEKKPAARYPSMAALEAALATEAARLEGNESPPKEPVSSTAVRERAELATQRMHAKPARPAGGEVRAFAFGGGLTGAALGILLRAITDHAVPLWWAAPLAVVGAGLGAWWARRGGAG